MPDYNTSLFSGLMGTFLQGSQRWDHGEWSVVSAQIGDGVTVCCPFVLVTHSLRLLQRNRHAVDCQSRCERCFLPTIIARMSPSI